MCHWQSFRVKELFTVNKVNIFVNKITKSRRRVDFTASVLDHNKPVINIEIKTKPNIYYTLALTIYRDNDARY